MMQNTLAVKARLDQLAELAEACRDTFLTISADTHWQAQVGSAANEAKVEISEMDPIADPKSISSGFDLVTEVIVTYMEVAAAHLAGLGALYRSGEAMFPPLPLVRSVLEYSAHAMWVIGDGKDSSKDILARAYLEEFVSCESAKLAAAKMSADGDKSITHTKTRWTTVRQRAIKAFPGTTKKHLAEPVRVLNTQKLPGAEACVAWMFKHIQDNANGSLNPRQAQGIYAFLCGGTHASLYHARQLRDVVEQGDHQVKLLRLDVGFLERLLSLAVVAFYNTLAYAISYFGLDEKEHRKLTEKFEAVLPGSLI